MPYIEFEIWCSCGNGLCNQTRDVKGGISVEPCENCLENAKDEGYNTGYKEGQEDMRNERRPSGVQSE